MSTDFDRLRMDFVYVPRFVLKGEKTEEGELKDVHVELIQEIVPHPDRYELVEENGKKWYKDKYSDNMYALEMVQGLIAEAKEMSLKIPTKKMSNWADYLSERKMAIETYLDKEENLPEFSDNSDDFLRATSVKNFVFLSFDIVGSTQLIQKLPLEQHRRIVSLIQRELTLLVDQFNGLILKFTGDGIIAYFPGPDMLGPHDNAIDCASLIPDLMTQAINLALRKHGLPEINFRIGLDSGRALPYVTGFPGIKSQTDLVGEAIYLASKIQSKAETNSVYVGESVATYVHTGWRQHLQEVKLEQWPYQYKDGRPYRLYRLVLPSSQTSKS